MAMRETIEARNLKEAICSLYELFPSVNTKYNGCSDLKTAEVGAIKKKIAKRERELIKIKSEDKTLRNLHNEMKKLVCDTATKANALHAQVDALLRKFQLRGVSAELIRDVEKMASVKPIVAGNCVCDDGDDE